MKILALEFSSEQRSVAIAIDGEIRGSDVETEPRVTRAFAMIERTLDEAQLQREQIECLVVGIGPGSYTGIRAAIALAQGWQLATGAKLLGISSAECLATEAQACGFFSAVNIVIDAQREELYLAHYQITAQSVQEVTPLKLATLAEARAQSACNEIFAGPDATRWFPDGKIIFPTAATLAKLASQRTDFVPGEKLEPIYLRETNFVKAPPPRVLPAN